MLVRADGRPQDLRRPLADGAHIQILTTRDTGDPDALAVLRHSSAHLLAEAVRRLYPGVKVAIGPPIENGFYYDFDFPEPITDADLEQIEAEVRRELKRVACGAPELTRDKARERFLAEDEPYKVELVDTAEGEITLYEQGDFVDLCRGPHLQSSKPIKAFKLTSLAGAYWRGDEHNKQLTRIYGTAFYSQADLDAYLRAVGGCAPPRPPPARAQLDLFHFEASPGAALGIRRGWSLEHARVDAQAREREARLRRGEDAADVGHRALEAVGPLGEVQHQPLPDPVRRVDLRPEADELPGAHAALRLAAAELPRAAAALRRGGGAAP